jgi:hypothetical protein
MALNIKVYTIKDLIWQSTSGNIDLTKSKEIVRELAVATLLHPDDNILIDLRKTTGSQASMADAMEIVSEFILQVGPFRNKIASIVPNDDDVISMTKYIGSCLTLQHYQYKTFTNFEDAFEWLSEVETL